MDNSSSIRNVCRGRWALEIRDSISYPIHRAMLSVIYESEQMKWFYESTVSQEIAMSRYEDQEYFRSETHSETDFPGREELIDRLMAFIPDPNGAKTREDAMHGFRRSPKADRQIREGLDSFFRKETDGSTVKIRL